MTTDPIDQKIAEAVGHDPTLAQSEVSSASQDVCRVMAYLGPILAAANRGYLITENADEFLLYDQAQSIINRVMDRMRVAAEAYYGAPDLPGQTPSDPDAENWCLNSVEDAPDTHHLLGTEPTCPDCVAHRFAS